MSARLGGRYQLVAEIGAGGMGRVYQAIDTETGRAVAAKVMVAVEDNLDALLRFQQEGAVLATLRHENIVEVYGAFLEVEQQTSCIIMELLEGRSLGQILRAERLSLSRAKRLVDQVAAALTYAHGRGIVHRDIKPDNIMVVGNDHVKVTDFGIARFLRSGSTLNTAAGMSVGTPLYMSPEQIEGQKVDGRTDIYSLGAVMYQIVTGKPPFEGDDPLTIAFKHVHKAPEAPSDVAADIPREWEDVILKALAKDPSDRFQTASAMEDAIRALPEEHPSPAARQAPAVETPTVFKPPNADSTHVNPRFDTPAVRPSYRVDQGATLPPRVVQPAEESQPSSQSEVHQAPESDVRVEETKAPVSAETSGTGGRRDRRLLVGAGAAILLVLIVAAAAYLIFGHTGTSKTTTPPTVAPTGAALTQVNQWGSTGSSASGLKSPADVSVDHSGDLYIADTGNNRIQRFAASTDPLGAWGHLGAELNQFDGPRGIALDGRSNVYVADTGNNRIQEFSQSGKLQNSWGSQGSGDAQFAHPSGIAVDAQGNMYIADTDNNRIVKLSPSGATLSWGSKGTGGGQFDHPTGIALDAQGDVFVADTGNNRIQELASTSDPIGQWGTQGSGRKQFEAPQGVAVDSHGNIFVADTGNNRLQELTQSGQVLFVGGTAGSGPAQLNRPAGIVVDSNGHVYVTDTGNDRVQELAIKRSK